MVRAEVKMPAIFGDHMVLQRNGAVPVWGWADAGEEILVTAGVAKVKATAGQDGNWQVKLPKMTVSTYPMDLVVAGKTNTLTFHDVLVGDVWLCSGQSNMEFVTGRANNATEALPRANHPEIRFFLVANHAVPFKPQTDCKGTWEVCTPVTAKKFSAVGYFFAEQIAASQKTPVGMVGDYVPGTAAQSWISVEPLLADAAMEKKYAQGYQRLSENFDALKAAHDQWQKEFGDDYKKALGAYYPLRDKARREGQPEPTPPPKPATPEPFFPKPPSFFFNGMIAPIIPYAIKGVLWYQGETNAPTNLPSKNMAEILAPWLFEMHNWKHSRPWPTREWLSRLTWGKLKTSTHRIRSTLLIDLCDAHKISPMERISFSRVLFTIRSRLTGKRFISNLNMPAPD
jgi:sialate O-acetylesterase